MAVRYTLLAASGVLMAVALSMSLLWAPPDINLGDTQRIFYFHVPVAWVGFLAFGVVFVASVAYLVKPSPRWDYLAYSSAELGVIFTTLMLISGIAFSKVAWGIWWSWTPKLTTSIILWFIYIGYLMLRSYVPKGSKSARYGAVLGIMGFIDVPIVFFAANWWRDLHPERIIGPGQTLEWPMLVTLLVSVIAFTFLYIYLLVERYTLRRVEETLDGTRYALG